MGVFANALTAAVSPRGIGAGDAGQGRGGIATWLMERLRRRALPERRLAVLERINLAPRQTLALVEADGERVLVATSQDGTPAFYPLISRTSRGRSRKTRTEGTAK